MGLGKVVQEDGTRTETRTETRLGKNGLQADTVTSVPHKVGASNLFLRPNDGPSAFHRRALGPCPCFTDNDDGDNCDECGDGYKNGK